jgi:D-sedoheptulose 7-phosphate isomerase
MAKIPCGTNGGELMNYFDRYLESAELTMARARSLAPMLESTALRLVQTLRGGGVVYWCGNGGSAADCQHLAAELVGRFERNRQPLASVALTTDSSVLTALGNDYGYDSVFERQIEALGRPGDALVGISTSGNSPNVVAALAAARRLGVTTVALTGETRCAVWDHADYLVAAPSSVTSHIQEVHIAVGQALCGRIESEMFP